MSEIKEGDQVVTPEGRIGKVDSMLRDGKSLRVEVNKVGFQDDLIEDLVKVDQPIRVKVSRECYAESLVALSREHGFGCQQSEDEIIRRSVHNTAGHDDHIQLFPDDKRISVDDWYDFDLTYAQDLPQIEGWLQANAESEDDECEVNLPEGVGELEKPDTPRPDGPANLNPNCTDESEEYDEPKADVLLTETPLTIEQYNSLDADLKETIYQKDQRINDLQSELSDCWENQQEYKNDVAELQGKISFWKSECSNRESIIDELQNERAELEEQLQDVREKLMAMKRARNAWYERYGEMDEQLWERTKERDNLQERIEEAREYIKNNDIPILSYNKHELLEILSIDSDEGDGECG